MEKKTKHVLVGISAVAGLVGAGWLIRRQYKKEIANLKEEEQSKTSEIVEVLGVTEEVAKDIVEKDASVTQLVYRACSGGDPELSIPVDALEIESARMEDSVIHVKTDYIRKRDQIDFIIQIPDYTKRGEIIKIGDYKSAIKDKIADWEDLYGVSPCASKLVGFLTMQYRYTSTGENGEEVLSEPIVETMELSPKMYFNFATETENGLIPFYNDYSRNKEIDEDVQTEIGNFLAENYDVDDITEISFLKIFLGWKVSFPIKTDPSVDGIGAREIAEIAKNAYDDLEVIKNNSRKTWDYVVFHPSDDDGKGIMNVVFDGSNQRYLHLPEKV